jgi:hypothetical protein
MSKLGLRSSGATGAGAVLADEERGALSTLHCTAVFFAKDDEGYSLNVIFVFVSIQSVTL